MWTFSIYFSKFKEVDVILDKVCFAIKIKSQKKSKKKSKRKNNA